MPRAAGEGRKPGRAMLTNASLLAVSLDGLDHELRRMGFAHDDAIDITGSP